MSVSSSKNVARGLGAIAPVIALFAACSSSSTTSGGQQTDAGGDGSKLTADSGNAIDAAGGDASETADADTDAGGCSGTAPNCFGGDITMCCGQDPSGTAQCVDGVWKCGSADAPGCNGTSCLAPQDAGTDG
jgi:hypothetical protein